MNNDMASASTLCCGTTSSIVSLDFSITSAYELKIVGGWKWHVQFTVSVFYVVHFTTSDL